MLNTQGNATNMTATWSEIPELQDQDSVKVMDVWTGKDLGCIADEYSVQVESHDTAGLLVAGEC